MTTERTTYTVFYSSTTEVQKYYINVSYHTVGGVHKPASLPDGNDEQPCNLMQRTTGRCCCKRTLCESVPRPGSQVVGGAVA